MGREKRKSTSYCKELVRLPYRHNRWHRRRVWIDRHTWDHQWPILEGRGTCSLSNWLEYNCVRPIRLRNRNIRHSAIDWECRDHCHSGTGRYDMPGNLLNTNKQTIYLRVKSLRHTHTIDIKREGGRWTGHVNRMKSPLCASRYPRGLYLFWCNFFISSYSLQSDSSEPSAQSARWSHLRLVSTHPRPSEQRNLSSRQEVTLTPNGQSSSSDPSRQSRKPSHFFSTGKQMPLEHLISFDWQCR